MTTEQTAFLISYATIHSAAGDSAVSNAVAQAHRVLREEQVLAALQHTEDGEVVALIPVTDAGNVVALDQEGRLRFDLSAEHLRERFVAENMSLNMVADDGDSTAEVFSSLTDDMDEGLFEPEPVRVVEFSRRGPWAARVTSQILNADTEYVESGTWSLYRYGTDRPHMAISGGAADRPIIELNLPQFGHAWVEVTTRSGATAMFWPNSERLTEPVLDVAAIGTPESAELYRRMLVEADGARNELHQLGALVVDIKAAHRACMPEALGGVAGEQERLMAFIRAFDVPSELVEAAFESQTKGRRFHPRGWASLIGELLVGGISEASALTRRQRPLMRIENAVRARPLLGAALSAAELTAGVALGRGRSRLGRVLGRFLIIDALVDMVIWVVRLRRR